MAICTKLICEACEIDVPRKYLVELNLFEDAVLLCHPYSVKSPATPDVFKIFVKALKGENVVVTAENRDLLMRLSQEFGFQGLDAQFDGNALAPNEPDEDVVMRWIFNGVKNKSRMGVNQTVGDLISSIKEVNGEVAVYGDVTGEPLKQNVRIEEYKDMELTVVKCPLIVPVRLLGKTIDVCVDCGITMKALVSTLEWRMEGDRGDIGVRVGDKIVNDYNQTILGVNEPIIGVFTPMMKFIFRDEIVAKHVDFDAPIASILNLLSREKKWGIELVLVLDGYDVDGEMTLRDLGKNISEVKIRAVDDPVERLDPPSFLTERNPLAAEQYRDAMDYVTWYITDDGASFSVEGDMYEMKLPVWGTLYEVEQIARGIVKGMVDDVEFTWNGEVLDKSIVVRSRPDLANGMTMRLKCDENVNDEDESACLNMVDYQFELNYHANVRNFVCRKETTSTIEVIKRYLVHALLSKFGLVVSTSHMFLTVDGKMLRDSDMLRCVGDGRCIKVNIRDDIEVFFVSGR